MWQFLFYLTLSYYITPQKPVSLRVCFSCPMRDRNSVHPDGRVGGEEQGGIDGGETIIRISNRRKKSIFNKWGKRTEVITGGLGVRFAETPPESSVLPDECKRVLRLECCWVFVYNHAQILITAPICEHESLGFLLVESLVSSKRAMSPYQWELPPGNNSCAFFVPNCYLDLFSIPH